MYSAQHTPAPSAKAAPTGSTPAPSEPSGSKSHRPNTARAIQRKSTGRREANSATASGPVNSSATPTPSGIVRRAM
ncbi:hypothetical protein D3C80_1583800 [compost metagenome]